MKCTKFRISGVIFFFINADNRYTDAHRDTHPYRSTATYVFSDSVDLKVVQVHANLHYKTLIQKQYFLCHTCVIKYQIMEIIKWMHVLFL